MEIQALSPSQRNYFYSQSTQISMQTGLIGHLRGDFGSTGQVFWSDFFDFRKELKVPAFKEDLDKTINELREGGIMSSRDAVSRYCTSHPQGGFDGSYTKEYGYRVDTKEYAYLMRFNPSRGDYNFYIYCYKREWLDRHLQRAANGIRFITAQYQTRFTLADGDMVRIVHPGGDAHDYTARYIDEYRVELSDSNGTNMYHICELAERLERNGTRDIIPLRASLPATCYSMLAETGEIIGLKKGEMGYYKVNIPAENKEIARKLIDNYNEKLGVSRAQEEAMKAGSMFGWDATAANPKWYDSQGKLRLVHHSQPER